MNISEEELRAMIRAAVSRARSEPRGDGHAVPESHASHARLTLLGGGDADGQCLIEPAVRCTHCGYCQSLGH
jgi:hypothetical protein